MKYSGNQEYWLYITPSGNLTLGKIDYQIASDESFYNIDDIKVNNKNSFVSTKIDSHLSKLTIDTIPNDNAVNISQKNKNNNSIHPYKIKFNHVSDYNEFVNLFNKLKESKPKENEAKEQEKKNMDERMELFPYPLTIYDHKYNKYYYFLFCNPRNTVIWKKQLNDLKKIPTSFNLLLNEISSLSSSEICMFRLLSIYIMFLFYVFFLRQLVINKDHSMLLSCSILCIFIYFYLFLFVFICFYLFLFSCFVVLRVYN